MNSASEKIPFAIEIGRVIELLAAQIYPTPFALIRENVQNAFDAILLRQHLGHQFDPLIEVSVEPSRVHVVDNGIGMSRQDLREHFWRAGSSSKNTDEARAAGVVGTFGIGAMANFGIAEELIVETEAAVERERTVCSATRSTLSVTEDCIRFEERPSTGRAGTAVTAIIQPSMAIDVATAVAYIAPIVAFLPIEVRVNGQVLSRQSMEESVAPITPATWSTSAAAVDLGGGISADIELSGGITGEVRILMRNIVYGGQRLEGRMFLRQGQGVLRTFRSGFGLATTSVSSIYQLGGVADLAVLQPTAGREALTTASMQVLQTITARVDDFVSLNLADNPESNASSAFVSWAAQRRRFDLCSHLRVRIEPGDSIRLRDVRDRSQVTPALVYYGEEQSILNLASEERPIIVLSRGAHRRECEVGYLRQFCKIEEISNDPRVLAYKPETETSAAESALSFRLASILLTDYFLEAHVQFGAISHGLPILVTSRKPPVDICLDPNGSNVKLMLELYDREYSAFGHMAKDFVRHTVFPRIADLVPSATRQGAEAFLKAVYRGREVFEYESTDLESLTKLWQDYLSGKLSYQQAAEGAARTAVRSYQVLDAAAAAPVRDVVPDVIENEASLRPAAEAEFGPRPPIQRVDLSTDRKLLTIADGEPALKGYRCFLALTDRIREEKGDFFLQPHRTSVVWGGQKALFIFEHHSGEFGLYYDLQTQSLISDQSGGGSFETCTIVMKNRIFIPIPTSIQQSFLPHANEKKRFEVRCDVLYTESTAHS